MAENWWFKFEWERWLNDEDLLSCSLETQGFWIKCIAMMHRAGVSEFTGSIDQLRRKFGILPEELTRCLMDLRDNGAADVRFGKENVGDFKTEVSIKSRRLQRELKSKEQNRLYVAKHRAKKACKGDGKGDVSPHIYSKSYIKSKKEEEREASQAPPTTTKPKRGTRIPEPFYLTPEMREYAEKKRPGVDVNLETEKFVNYWRAAPGTKGTKLDWLATWRNWILNASTPYTKAAAPPRFDPGRPTDREPTIELCPKCGSDVCLGGPACEERRLANQQKPETPQPGAYVN